MLASWDGVSSIVSAAYGERHLCQFDAGKLSRPFGSDGTAIVIPVLQGAL